MANFQRILVKVEGVGFNRPSAVVKSTLGVFVILEIILEKWACGLAYERRTHSCGCVFATGCTIVALKAMWKFLVTAGGKLLYTSEKACIILTRCVLHNSGNN